MGWEELLGAIIGVCFAGWLVREHPIFLLSIVGAFLIANFTLYAAIIIFATTLGYTTSLFVKGERFAFTRDAVKVAAAVTGAAIVIGLALSAMLDGSGGGSCSRSTPQFC